MDHIEFKAARKALGYTQAGLADVLGVDPATIRRWEASPDLKSAVPPKKTAVMVVSAMLEAMK